MTTTSAPWRALPRRLPRPLPRPLTRAVLSGALTLALVAVFLLVPDATRSYAALPLGVMRAPGDSAFIAAHRGDRSSAPENTIPALAAALAGPFDFVETDVQLSADGVPVLIHDFTLDRTTDGAGPVSLRTLAELQALDAGGWYSEAYRGTRIPTLVAFLDLLSASGKKAIVELKGAWTGPQIAPVLRDIYLRGVQDRVVFASLEPRTLLALRATDRAIPRVLISKLLRVDEPAALAESLGAIGVFTSAKFVIANPGVVERLHAAGLTVVVYTMNSEKRWSAARELGVDGIVTDEPSELDLWLARTAPGT